MTLKEIVQAAMKNNAEAFGKLPEKRAVAVVRAVLAEVNNQVESAEGTVLVAGFGRFIVRQKEVEKDGAKVMQRRIAFRPAAAKAAAGTRAGKTKSKA